MLNYLPFIYSKGRVAGLEDLLYIMPLAFIVGKSIHCKEDSVVPYQSLLLAVSCYMHVIGKAGSLGLSRS